MRFPCLVAALVGLLVSGCASRSDLTIRSAGAGTSLERSFRTVAYIPEDENSAYVYMTDLSRADLEPGAPIDRVSGHIVRVHMFLKPRAGRTPIEDTATNAVVDVLVLADGAAGLYEGAGFLQPSGTPGGARFSGSMNGATLRLIGKNARFADALGPSRLGVSFSAPLDRPTATLIAGRLDEMRFALTDAE